MEWIQILVFHKLKKSLLFGHELGCPHLLCGTCLVHQKNLCDCFFFFFFFWVILCDCFMKHWLHMFWTTTQFLQCILLAFSFTVLVTQLLASPTGDQTQPQREWLFFLIRWRKCHLACWDFTGTRSIWLWNALTGFEMWRWWWARERVFKAQMFTFLGLCLLLYLFRRL